MTEQRDNGLEQVGKGAMASIRDMVAALECDYDRLEELRDERTAWVENDGGDDDEQARTDEAWAAEFPTEAAELAELVEEAGDCTDREDAEQRILEDALSLRIFGERTDGEWVADRFELLLGTGGPAVRIMGELEGGEAHRAWLEVQDWGTPWTHHYESGMGAVLLTYARCFCYE
jgi:hypothetical protein